jgi:RNA polymerase sigma-70 factor
MTPVIDEIYERCRTNAPNFGVREECFHNSLNRTLDRFCSANENEKIDDDAKAAFLNSIQADDLFMAIACSNGNERAWWEFDQHHRAYLERVARHLAQTDLDAQEVVDQVYVELYGTKVVDGERVSKFASYSGRGTLRGWLRTVVWHSLVDLHRASHEEVSLDEMTENVGEGMAHAYFAEPAPGGEETMLDDITRNRYRRATVESLSSSFGQLDEHEKLLLLFYHVDSLKLREIARLVENEDSPLREWFQRKSRTREKNPGGRIHESTIMRWLEKCYAKVLQNFKAELRSGHKLSPEEMDICLELATQDLTAGDLYKQLRAG